MSSSNAFLDYHCRSDDNSFYNAVFYVPMTNLEYLEFKYGENQYEKRKKRYERARSDN